VLNEERLLAWAVSHLLGFLPGQCPFDFELVIADNGSTDSTVEIAKQIAQQHGCVKVLHLEEPGRGRALKTAWAQSEADILAYMDVDLSTDLSGFFPLIQPLANGEYDLATGSRLLPGSVTNRSLNREVISRWYNALVKAMFNIRFSDAQCGFKAITRAAAARLLPLIEDDGWFMDTELLVVAEKLGYRILDLPVRWCEHGSVPGPSAKRSLRRKSRVKILRTVAADLRGLVRLHRTLRSGKYCGEAGRLAKTPVQEQSAKVFR
jgi:glycosyltransferase involved in cell wall biosynthesis